MGTGNRRELWKIACCALHPVVPSCIPAAWGKGCQFMSSDYKRLIELAAETDVTSTPEKIATLNELLSQQRVDSIDSEDLSLLDDLISSLSITGNLFSETHDSVIALQEEIRSKQCCQ